MIARIRTGARVLAYVGATVALAACPNPDPDKNGVTAPGARLAGRYGGTLTTTVEYRDPSGRSVGTQTYTVRNATVTVSDPRTYRDQTESNPVSVIVESPPTTRGAVAMYSSLGGRYRDPRSGATVNALFTSWDLNVSGSQITGQLTDNLTSQASNVSQIMDLAQLAPGVAPVIWPFPMDNGATLSASVSGGTISVRINGTAASGRLEFTAQMTAERL